EIEHILSVQRYPFVFADPVRCGVCATPTVGVAMIFHPELVAILVGPLTDTEILLVSVNVREGAIANGTCAVEWFTCRLGADVCEVSVVADEYFVSTSK